MCAYLLNVNLTSDRVYDFVRLSKKDFNLLKRIYQDPRTIEISKDLPFSKDDINFLLKRSENFHLQLNERPKIEDDFIAFPLLLQKIIVRETGEEIGQIGVDRTRWTSNLTLYLDPKFLNQGHGSRTLAEYLPYVLEFLDLSEMQIVTAETNIGMRKLAEQFGFKFIKFRRGPSFRTQDAVYQQSF